MSIKYHLSNRQRKEIFVRGAELTIALPLPIEDCDDVLAWARSVLGDVDSQDIAEAREDEVVVRATVRAESGLPKLLGKIVRDEERRAPGEWHYAAAVILVTVRHAGREPRRTYTHPQWPGGSLLVDGQKID